MAIGDNYNDIEMLEFAGHPCIMGNATAELREPGLAGDAGQQRRWRRRGRGSGAGRARIAT
jgi:phosphoserine phosphatase